MTDIPSCKADTLNKSIGADLVFYYLFANPVCFEDVDIGGSS